ncbi:branched-chain amino acid ABC transporter permease [Actinotalea sp.]|uniref:branched-chain amino acid ABC transporter permease n=1 Tax=Actinotalea sp. TaxID=1872145 RepID=UPI002CE26DF0|nr:branched-chain amino acid ABC transporter permease [Actinotalea sp.]HQY34827.1 branched-chain amino acid ABC transporter permease [Actinotalea sp.]HRA50720.1 branched-chain amino acid ABC transporter permease [Actinotalea sp.]
MDWTRILNAVADAVIAPTTAAYALAAIGLNVHFGLTGLLNMGQAGFMLLGAYGFAISATAGWPLWASVLVAVTAAMLFGLLLGIPTLQLRGDYLAIVTIAAAEIVRIIGRSTSLTWLTGGNAGIAGDPFKESFQSLSPFPDGTTEIGPWSYSNNLSNSWWLRIVAWAVVALACFVMWRWMRSPWGRVLKGVREDEDALRSLGKNVYSYKMQALVLGGVFGALGGILYVLPRAVQPDSMGRPMTFYVWTILLLGGAATVFGPVLGSVLLWTVLAFVTIFLREIVPETVLRTEQIAMLGWILVGLTLMLLVIFRPQGIMGDKKELAINVR